MNIFATSPCPIISAKHHCDVHNSKLIVEAAQLLSTAHFELDGKQVGYKPTHRNHPLAIWARKSSGNYEWLWQHFKALCEEYEHRKGKVHASKQLLETLKTPPKNIMFDSASIDFQCFPVEFKTTLDVHKNYQQYLRHKFKEWENRTDKRKMKAEWTNREQPEWMK